MSDEYVSEIIKKVAKCETRLLPLYDRMCRDWDYFTSKAFQFEGKEKEDGEWDNFTANSAAVLGNWAVTTLSTAPLSIIVPTVNDKKAERSRNSKTELFCYGILNQADNLLADAGDPDIQSSLALDACLRGWTVKRLILLDDGDGVPRCDVAIWDMLNFTYGRGGRGLAWGNHKYYKDIDAARDEYGDSKVEPEKGDTTGRVMCYDYYDDMKESVIIGNTEVHEYEHKLGRVPINVRPAGARRLVQDMGTRETGDSIKYQGESIYLNNRELFDEEHEVLTYHKTALGLGAKTPLVLYYEGTLPKGFEKNPYVKGRIIPIKKGTEVKELVKPTMPQNTSEFHALISRQLAQGGISSVVLGAFESAGPAAGLNILTHAARNILQAPKKLIEQDMEWLCREAIAQYKHSEYKEVSLQGRTRLNKDFATTVSKELLIDDRRIECRLKPSLPQDDMMKAGIGNAAINSGALSKQTARERYYDVQDTDAEQDIIDRENAEDHPAIKLKIKAAKLLKDDLEGNAEVAEILNKVADDMLSKMLPGYKQPGAQNEPGMPVPPNPQAVAGSASRPVIPQDVAQAVQNRLSNIGMDYAAR